MERATFLRSSPRELDALLTAVSERERRRFAPAALICATIANIHRGEDTDPFTMENFMPGADGPKSKEEEMIEWLEHLEAVERGEEEEEHDQEALEEFKRKLKQTFRLGEAPKVQSGTTIGPGGKPKAVNAIAGEVPRRGLR